MSNGAKISLTGRLTKDAQQKPWQGTSYVSFTVAAMTSKKEGNKYLSDFYTVSVWGKLGEIILPKLKKGTMVVVHGDLTLLEYTDANNVKQKSLSVRASDVVVCSAPAAKEAESAANDDPPPF